MLVDSRATGLVCVAIVGLACLAGCTDNQDPSGARRLWQSIHAQCYTSWQRAPGYAQRRASNAPHGGAVEIFVNDTLAQTLEAEASVDSWPLGSAIVKAGFEDNELALVAVMEKRSDGWYWAEYDAQGDTHYSGKPALCTDCHESGADFVRAFGFPARERR